MTETPVPPPTAEEKAVVDYLRKEVPSSSADPEDVYFLSPTDEAVNDYTYIRFTRMHDGKKEKCLDALKKCLEWRKKEKPYLLLGKNLEDVCPVALHAEYLQVGGLDKKGRRILVIKIGNKNDADYEQRTTLFRYVMERITQKREYMICIQDFTALKHKNEDKNGKGTKEEVARYLEQCYPEVCQMNYLFNTPWYISSMGPLATAFMDSKSRARLKNGCQLKDLAKDMELTQIPKDMGGQFNQFETVKAGLDSIYS